MKNICPILGFLGSEKQDIITYLSRILHQLKKRVLVVDFSETNILRYKLPQEKVMYQETIKEWIIDYRGVDYYIYNNQIVNGEVHSWGVQENYFIKMLEEWRIAYDLILIDFGFIKRNEIIKNCSQIYYVTDLQNHNLNRLLACIAKEKTDAILLIKDAQPCKITSRFISREIGLVASLKKTYVIPFDIIDLKYKIVNSYKGNIMFRSLSKELEQALLEIITMTFPQLEMKTIKNAYSKAKKAC